MNFLWEYGLFLAKTLTIIISILLTLVGILILVRREPSDEASLVIFSLNEKMRDIKEVLQSETLTKVAYKKWLKKDETKAKKKAKNEGDGSGRLFVLRFEGDMKASEVEGLRETISALLTIAQPKDEVLIVLESAGGYVHSYGLAAAQIQRIKDNDLYLTIAVDRFAASGGYMMACVANQIIAAPFALVGSIGVLAQVPNFHRLLEKHSIDFEQHTAGAYKRTLTMFGKNTPAARQKFQLEIETTHSLFKEFITQHRPNVDIERAATGEHWHATHALAFGLVDVLMTSDEFILNKINEREVYEIGYEEKLGFTDKLSQKFFGVMEGFAAQLRKLSLP